MPLKGSSVRGSTLVGSRLGSKYLTRVEVNGSGKHSSSLLYGNSYGYKSFIVKVPDIYVIKLFVVIYNSIGLLPISTEITPKQKKVL